MSANTRCSSSHTVVVPFGDRLGRPSGVTVATKPSRCSSTARFMSSERFTARTLALEPPAGNRLRPVSPVLGHQAADRRRPGGG